MQRTKLIRWLLGTMCLCGDIALGESSGTLLVAEDMGDGVPREIRMGGGSPRGVDGCDIDNGDPDLEGPSNSSQYDSEYPFWAQVADTFMLDCADAACAGDANDDGIIDPLDDGFVKSRLGCDVGIGDEDCDSADVNGDGAVDLLDIGFVQARFGECTASGPTEAVITQIVFTSLEHNPARGNPGDWSGVRVTIYSNMVDDEGNNLPAGEPQDDGTILGDFVVDKIHAPTDFTWTEVDVNRFEVVLSTSMVVDNDTLYWIAISPMEFFLEQGQTAIISSFEGQGDGIASRQHFGLLGIAWDELTYNGPDGLPDTEDDTPREMAFTLTAEPATGSTGP